MTAELHVTWGKTVVVTLSNPGHANSVTPELVTEMARVFRRIDDDDDVTAMILTGDGRHFCAGADISDMQSVFAERGIDAAVDYMVDVWMPSVQRAALAIKYCRKVTIAAINGPATAGGLDFALSCDYTIAVPTAKIAESYINLGLLPVAAGIHHLSSRLRPGLARRMLLGGMVSTAKELFPLGLFDELAEPTELMDVAHAVAEEMSAGPDKTRQQYAEAFRLSEASFERQLAHALHANSLLLRDETVRQRFTQVLSRKPQAAGRGPSVEGR